MKKTIALIGCGQVGTVAALELARTSAADLVLFDVVEGLAQGRALDLAQAARPAGFTARVAAAEALDDTLGADIFVVTAGKPRLPGMTRADLLEANAAIVRGLASGLASAREDALFVIVTNPLDVMVTLFAAVSGRPRTRVIGMGGVLDSARMAYFTGLEAGVATTEVEAWVLGAHSDAMVPCFSLTKVAGRPALEALDNEQRERIAERTRKGGAEIVSYLKTGSAFLAPGASVAALVRALLADSPTTLPASVVLDGEFGFAGAALGVPAAVSAKGVEEVVELPLLGEERDGLAASFAEVKSQYNALVES